MAERKAPTKVTRALRGGQITIPVEFRKRLGITDETLLQVSLEGDELRIKPVHMPRTAAGSPWLQELYDQFAPVREEASGVTEEEVNAAIDRAVAAVRRKHAAGGA